MAEVSQLSQWEKNLNNYQEALWFKKNYNF
jgi:hypothetical protein